MPPIFWDNQTPKPTADPGQLSARSCCNTHPTGRPSPPLRTFLGGRGIPAHCALLRSPTPAPAPSGPEELSTPTSRTTPDPVLWWGRPTATGSGEVGAETTGVCSLLGPGASSLRSAATLPLRLRKLDGGRLSWGPPSCGCTIRPIAACRPTMPSVQVCLHVHISSLTEGHPWRWVRAHSDDTIFSLIASVKTPSPNVVTFLVLGAGGKALTHNFGNT